MRLEHLYLKYFRNYHDTHVSFEEGSNVFCGANGQGKSNLLEAIYLLVTGHSFRASQLKDLIPHEHPYLYIEGRFRKHGISQSLRVYYDGKTKKIYHNETSYPSFTNLLGVMPGVLFTTGDVEIIKGGPGKRRHFMDVHIAQYDPLYVHHLFRFHQAMKQRNRLLRRREKASIRSWEEVMAKAATYLINARRTILEPLQKRASEINSLLLAGQDALELSYKPSVDPLHYLEELERGRSKEMLCGFTLKGPHKDDMTIFIQKKDARYFASEGQQRSAVAVLRLAQWEHLREQREEKPLFLADDVNVGWDERRVSAFLEYLKGLGQVFITAPELKEAGYRIEQGKISCTKGDFKGTLINH